MITTDPQDKNSLFQKLNKDYSKVYKFVLAHYDYIYSSRDYGTGEILSMMEAHVLTDIVDSPGTTVTELAQIWEKSTSAISQTARKLIRKGYVVRENSTIDAKIFYLFPTESAVNFANAHKEFDTRNILRLRETLLESFTEKDLEIFLAIISKYTEILKEGTK